LIITSDNFDEEMGIRMEREEPGEEGHQGG
jgi:hypothetical protein